VTSGTTRDARREMSAAHSVPSAGVLSSAVPEMQNLDDLASGVNPIVDLVRRVQEFADSGPSGNQFAGTREALQPSQVVNQRLPQSAGCLRVISRDVINDVAEIVQRLVGDEDFEIH
jgi:hypothetical protein